MIKEGYSKDQLDSLPFVDNGNKILFKIAKISFLEKFVVWAYKNLLNLSL